MMYRSFADLGVYPPWRIVKVDDTEPGIAEAVAAGAWAVGVTLSGNGCGLSESELGALSLQERDAIRQRVARDIAAAGAHATIDTVADLLPALNAFGARIARGERP
jgi:phosphonoacetaldehyde hydrolase